jgi:hypothetical protein
MPVSVDAFKIHGRVEVDATAAQKNLRDTERETKSVVGSLKTLRAEMGSKFLSGDGLLGGLKSIGSNLANIKAGFDLVGSAGGFLFGLAKDAADAGSKFHDLSVQTDLSVETLSGLQLQLKQSGTDMDALGRATVLMQRNLGAAAGGSKEMQRAFAALGVRDARAALADTDGTLKTVTKSLGQMEHAGERNAAGSKVMGKGFKELSVFLKDTNGDLDAVIEASRKAGRVMSGEAADAADAFGDQLDELTNTASIAGRTVGLGAIPQITGAMRDLTGATGENASTFRAWGQELGHLVEFSRIAAESIAAFSFSDTGRGFAAKVEGIANRVARDGEIAAGKRFDLNAPSTPEQQARGARERERALAAIGVRPVQPLREQMGGDFFTPGKAGARARKDELDRLKAFAKEWDFTVTSLAGGRHNRGSAHYAGRAMDVSVRGKADSEVRAFMDAARQAGFGVRDERTRPEGQKVWSGPHVHLQMLAKATQAANKEFDEQGGILDQLARKVADAKFQYDQLSKSEIDREVGATRQALALHKLTDEQQAVAEDLLKEYEATLRARDATEKHAEATKNLRSLTSSLSDEILGSKSAVEQMTGALTAAAVPLGSYAGQWARLVGTMKDMEGLTPKMFDGGMFDGGMFAGMKDIPVGSGPFVDPAKFTNENGAAPPAPKPNMLKEAWKEFSTLGDETTRLKYAFVDLANSMRPQGQGATGKRGFFSKMLGFVAPFLNFIPGVGPILSLAAGIGSRALAGDYAGAVMGAAGGFASGGAFRGSGGSNPPVLGSPFRNITGGVGGLLTPSVPVSNLPGRATGGPVQRGRTYIVGEHQAEVFEPDEDGFIHPSVDGFGRGGRGAQTGARGGGSGGRGVMGGALAGILAQLERHAAAVEQLNSNVGQLHNKLGSMSAGDVLTAGARSPHGQKAIAQGWKGGVARDPKVAEWMQRMGGQ